MSLVTLSDVIDDLSVYAGKGVTGDTVAAVRAAAMGAIRELATHHTWNYYRTRYRYLTVAPQSGLLTYVASTRVATLGSGTWPSWAADGRLFVGIYEYQVEAVLTGTTARLAAAASPAADLTDPTGYQLVRDLYPLPADFTTAEKAQVADGGGRMAYRQFGTLTSIPLSLGRPGEFGTEPARTPPGRLAMRVWPAPGAVYPIEVLYRRRPAEPVVARVDAGPVAVAQNGLSATAARAVFLPHHVGTVVRLSFDAKPPTGPGGVNPFAAERVVTAVTTGGTVVEWADAVTVPAAKVGAVVSSLVDIEPGAMQTALFCMGRRYLRQALRSKTVGTETGDEARALAAARDADARFNGVRVISQMPVTQRLATMPVVEDS